MTKIHKSTAKQNTILSIKNLEVKFRVRSRILTAIRNVSFELYDGEILALVGESGSGKSVITKTFTGMLETNGWISGGNIVYNPNKKTLEDSRSFFKEPINLTDIQKVLIDKDIKKFIKKTNNRKILKLQKEYKRILSLDLEKLPNINEKILKLETKQKSATKKMVEFTKRKSRDSLSKITLEIESHQKDIILAKDKFKKEEYLKSLNNQIEDIKNDTNKFELKSPKENEMVLLLISFITQFIESGQVLNADLKNKLVDYYSGDKKMSNIEIELKEFLDSIVKNKTLDEIKFSKFLSKWNEKPKNTISKTSSAKKMLKEIRGKTIATIFQDPMTSLNPLLSVGFQISEVLIKQLKMTRSEAKEEAIKLLGQVGIPNPKERYKDIPGRYSGGMRQRVVIAIALACRPNILICDEPTTALDVTIQAQILRLIKKLQKEYNFSVIFITHDLGVVASIADRVAVMYAGQIVEIGTTEEIFNDSKHPYTWALLLSLPQLGTKGEDLYSIGGTPPSLFNEIKGDAFAPRNKYALAIDYLLEAPMFKVSETHYAKTWLLHEKVKKVIPPNKSYKSVKQEGEK
ncbi:oligopeptide ABC transporter ATP-binding protein OppD [Mesoplasma corruscae]|uniref:Oligopeptide ABC transporter ATP-binding protein n=1 Tax=Mesoplasma corruscae TaxID=216874 RepID=A0A2S5RHR7_9MOLU|nr:oligopeptide ABC transporter ATP-binding protein OppD [Mesoplasma corruscae]PPE06843.1 oligopeptide ABC transporter ATP-binding protein [Mesoplasma corruscae]